MQRLLNTEIRFWDLLGGRLEFSTATYFKVLRQKRTSQFMLLSLLIFFAADPSDARNYIPLWFSLVLWPVAFGFYLLFYHLQFLVCAALTLKMPRLRIPTALLSLVALVPTVILCESSVTYMSVGTFPYDVVKQTIFYFFSVQGLETVFYRFIFPEVRDEIECEDAARHLVIDGEKIDLKKLLHIEAREHHVQLTFEDAQSIARARLRDIVAQTQSEDGIQPHRSWWVAKDAGIKAERKGGRMILRLRDNTEVPVARSRVDDVLMWLDDHISPIS